MIDCCVGRPGLYVVAWFVVSGTLVALSALNHLAAVK